MPNKIPGGAAYRLKPCPFCGGIVIRKIGFMGINFFRCRACGATMSFDSDYYNTHKNEAVEAYNKRYEEEK